MAKKELFQIEVCYFSTEFKVGRLSWTIQAGPRYSQGSLKMEEEGRRVREGGEMTEAGSE